MEKRYTEGGGKGVEKENLKKVVFWLHANVRILGVNTGRVRRDI